MYFLIITIILIIRYWFRIWTTYRDLNFLLPPNGLQIRRDYELKDTHLLSIHKRKETYISLDLH